MTVASFISLFISQISMNVLLGVTIAASMPHVQIQSDIIIVPVKMDSMVMASFAQVSGIDSDGLTIIYILYSLYYVEVS